MRLLYDERAGTHGLSDREITVEVGQRVVVVAQLHRSER